MATSTKNKLRILVFGFGMVLVFRHCLMKVTANSCFFVSLVSFELVKMIFSINLHEFQFLTCNYTSTRSKQTANFVGSKSRVFDLWFWNWVLDAASKIEIIVKVSQS